MTERKGRRGGGGGDSVRKTEDKQTCRFLSWEMDKNRQNDNFWVEHAKTDKKRELDMVTKGETDKMTEGERPRQETVFSRKLKERYTLSILPFN